MPGPNVNDGLAAIMPSLTFTGNEARAEVFANAGTLVAALPLQIVPAGLPESKTTNIWPLGDHGGCQLPAYVAVVKTFHRCGGLQHLEAHLMKRITLSLSALAISMLTASPGQAQLEEVGDAAQSVQEAAGEISGSARQELGQAARQANRATGQVQRELGQAAREANRETGRAQRQLEQSARQANRAARGAADDVQANVDAGLNANARNGQTGANANVDADVNTNGAQVDANGRVRQRGNDGRFNNRDQRGNRNLDFGERLERDARQLGNQIERQFSNGGFINGRNWNDGRNWDGRNGRNWNDGRNWNGRNWDNGRWNNGNNWNRGLRNNIVAGLIASQFPQASNILFPQPLRNRGVFYRNNDQYYFYPAQRLYSGIRQTGGTVYSNQNYSSNSNYTTRGTIDRSAAVPVEFGGYQFVSDLAPAFAPVANELALELHYNYRNNPNFNQVYRDAYSVLTEARALEQAQQRGDREQVQQHLIAANRNLNQVMTATENWQRSHQKQIGEAGLETKLQMTADMLNHMMYDIGIRQEQVAGQDVTNQSVGYRGNLQQNANTEASGQLNAGETIQSGNQSLNSDARIRSNTNVDANLNSQQSGNADIDAGVDAGAQGQLNSNPNQGSADVDAGIDADVDAGTSGSGIDAGADVDVDADVQGSAPTPQQ